MVTMFGYRPTIFVLIVLGITSGEDKCFRGVEEHFNELKNKLENTPHYTKVPRVFENIHNLNDIINAMKPNISSLKYVPDKLIAVANNVLKISNKLATIKEMKDMIGKINEKLQELRNHEKNYTDRIDVCKKALSNVTDLRGRINDVLVNVNADYLRDFLKNSTDRINKIVEKSLNLKKELDSLPTFYKYTCNSRLQKSLNETMELARSILDYMSMKLFKKELKKLKFAIDSTKKDIHFINGLERDVPDVDLKISSDTDALLKRLQTLVDVLMDKMNRLRDNKDEANPEIEKFKERYAKRLKNIDNFFSRVFSEDNINKINEQIYKFERILRLFDDRNTLRTKLKEIRKITLLLEKQKVCNVNASFTPEDTPL